MRKNFRKNFVNFFLFPLTLLVLVFYISFLINPDILFKPVLAQIIKAAPKNKNVYCQLNSENKITPEFEKAIRIIDEKFLSLEINSDFQELAKCVEISYAESKDKFTENKIQGKFEVPEDNSELKIIIDSSYKQKDPLFLSLILAHELTHTKQYFDYQKTWEIRSCLNREAEAFQTEILFFTALNSKEKDWLLDKIKKDSSLDSISKSLERLVEISTDSIISCQKESPEKLFGCFEKNNLETIKNSLTLNKNYINQCKL